MTMETPYQSVGLSRYETWELDELLAQIERPNPWLLRTFFPREKLFRTKVIEFDLIDRGRRMAPFVSPFTAGKPMRREGSRVRQLAPAYVKETHLVTPNDATTRMPGEPYGGTMTPRERADAIVSEYLANAQDRVTNRLEWMAASALVNSSITITGEDYPTTVVNFGRDSSLTLALTGAATWSQTTSTPMDNIESMALQVREISKGAVVTDLVMDGATWQLLRANESMTDLISAFYRRGDSSIDGAPRTVMNEAQLVGRLNGRIDMWVYDAYIQDDTGTDQPLIPQYTCLGIARTALEGTQYYGRILDFAAEVEASKFFAKSKEKFEPSALEIVTASAPLVAPRRPNAMFKITVN